MAKRRKTARRSSSTYHKKRTSHKSSGGSMASGWIPLNGKEIALGVGVGAVSVPLNNFLKPYEEQYLGMFGDYKDEAGMAIVGSLAHKFGSGLIKDAGKEFFRMATFSSGQQLGNTFLGSSTSGSSAPSGVQYM